MNQKILIFSVKFLLLLFLLALLNNVVNLSLCLDNVMRMSWKWKMHYRDSNQKPLRLESHALTSKPNRLA